MRLVKSQYRKKTIFLLWVRWVVARWTSRLGIISRDENYSRPPEPNTQDCHSALRRCPLSSTIRVESPPPIAPDRLLPPVHAAPIPPELSLSAMATPLAASRASLTSLSSRFSALSLRPTATPAQKRLRRAAFSTSAPQSYPRTHRGNKRRGMSAMRGTGLGPWIKLSVKPEDVEAPRQIEIQPEESPEHGLWNFFNPQRTILSTPVEESRHGMASVLPLGLVTDY